MDAVFLDLGMMIIIATVVAFFARFFRQPLIPAYIVAGLLIGPGMHFFLQTSAAAWLGLPPDMVLIEDHDLVKTLSEIGIAFLLFIVGLEIDLKKLKGSGKVAVYGGLFVLLSLILTGFMTAYLLGFQLYESLYAGLIVAFSSTMMVLKVLSDRKEIDTLHGRIVIAILLLQDIVAILAMMVINSFSTTEPGQIINSIMYGIGLLLLAVLSGKYFFPVVFKSAAKSQEMLLLASLSVCFTFAILFAGSGYSIAIGSFVVGIVLGNLPYSFEIIGRVKSIRDFFATLFFVSLGLQVDMGAFADMFVPFMVLLFIVVVIKPLLMLLIMLMFGYKKRTGFLTALSLGQTSEFSIILVLMGMQLGHVSGDIFSLAIFLTIASFFFSSYFIKFEFLLYRAVSKKLDLFEHLSGYEHDLEYNPPDEKHEVLLIGYSRTGYNIFHKLVDMKKRFMIVDFNPDKIKRLIKRKVPCIYGDISNPEVIEKIDFRSLKFVISTISDPFASRMLISKAKKKNKNIAVFVTSYHMEDALSLYEIGADYVILPHFLGGYHASVLLEEVSTDVTKLIQKKSEHLKELYNRREMGHSYPHRKHYTYEGKHHV